MSTNLRVNERSKKSFSVTRYSGFDGVRVQVTTARDSKEELDFTDKFFNTVNLNRNEAIDLAHALIAFASGDEQETFDTVPLQVQKNQWKRDNNKVRPGTNKNFTPRSFSKVLVENQQQLSGNDKLYYDSRRTGTQFGTKFSEVS
jgi:hypothetical protein